MTPTPTASDFVMKTPARRHVNFGAGPSKLPDKVLATAQSEFLDYANTGSNLMELSHRSSHFNHLLQNTVDLLKELLAVPDNYRILLMQGGGNGQFAAVPLNLINRSSARTADYLVTGQWSQAAAKEAANFGNVHMVLPGEYNNNYTTIPDCSTWKFSEDAAFVYFCDNETVNGLRMSDKIFDMVPKDVPLVTDVSSNIMARHLDVSRYGVVFAGAQKNLGAAGLTVVIVRDDLLDFALPYTPSVLNYKKMSESNSLYNTPPTYSIYVCRLVLQWVRDHGGLDKMVQLAQQKSSLLYSVIDNSNGFYRAPVEPQFRSLTNVVFMTTSASTDVEFVEAAASVGLNHLQGHRKVGGLRASLYNAISLEETQHLANFMHEFMSRTGANDESMNSKSM